MKLLLLTIISLSFTIKIYSQSNFDNGFKSGFKNGYCYSNQASGTCYPPIPPLPPLPQLNESRDSYNDGYNRGFLYGQSKRNNEERASSSTRSVNSNPPKFNSYVDQNPINNLSSSERAQYYNARARQDQEAAEAIGALLSHIIEGTPEGRARRARKRAWNNEKKKIKAEIKAEKKQYEQSVKFQNKPELPQNKPELPQNKPELPQNTTKYTSNNLSKNLSNNKIQKKLKYFCVIYENDIVNGKLQVKNRMKGYVQVNDSSISFKNEDNNTMVRDLFNEKVDTKTNTFSYTSDYGKVEIDYQKNEVRFYDESNKKCWIYDIITLAQ